MNKDRPRDNSLLVYEMLYNRRIAYDNLVWQVPVLSLTAQAFLFTVALSGDTSPWARRIAALLALLSALVSLQTMAKHRFFEEADSRGCERLEDELGLTGVLGYAPHVKFSERQRADKALIQQPDDEQQDAWTKLKSVVQGLGSFLLKGSSLVLWQSLLMVFAASAAVIIVLSFTGGLS